MKKKLKQIHHSSVPFSLSFGFLLGLTCISLFQTRFFKIRVIALIFFFCLVNAFIFKSLGRLFFACSAGVLLALARYQSIAESKSIIEQNLGKTIEVSLKASTDAINKSSS